MAVETHGILDDLERQRLELEDNVRQLRQSLYNWRLWEAEYDGLKDELQTLKQDCTSAQIFQAGIDLDGTVVDAKEVKALLGEGQGITRSRDQVVQQISRRLDYVRQNVASMEKRLSTAELNLDRLLSVERPGPNAATEEYAVTEIFEQLDEKGEVVSSKISTPADRAPEVMDILKKAGVEVPKGADPEQRAASVGESGEGKVQKPGQDYHAEDIPSSALVQARSPSVEQIALPPADTNLDQSEESNDSESEPTSEVDESPEDAKLRREMLEYGFREVGKVVAELEMDEEGSDVSYEDEDFDNDEYEDEEEDEFGRTTRPILTEEYHQQMKELEERLQAGGFVNLGPAKNMSAEARASAEAASQAGVLKVTTIDKNTDTKLSNNGDEKKKLKKKVAFAEELDIAPPSAPPPPAKSEKKVDVINPDVTPLSESVVERSTTSANPSSKNTTATAASTTKKASRFKSARKDGTPTPGDSSTPNVTGNSIGQGSILKKSDQAPTTSSISLFPARPNEPKPFSQPIIASGDVFSAAKPSSLRSEPQPPEGKISSETLFERPPVVNSKNVHAPDPDELDEEIHRKEIASEFYRRRNMKIQQSGGFLKTDEDDHAEGELYELDENDQPKRRVSKFKAARIRP